MGKIPIGRSIGEAFDFALGRYWPILGVIWLPLLLLGAAEYYVLVPYFEGLFAFIRSAAQHPKQYSGLPPELEMMRLRVWSLNALALVVSIWMQTGIAKTALGLRTGPLFVYVPVGLDELRAIGGFLVFLAIVYGAAIVIGIVIAIGAILLYSLVAGGVFAFTAAMRPWAVGALMALIAAVVAALFYIQVRFTFLLVPATVAEKRFGLWRSWELSRGNFWRIFTIGVGTLSPILVFEFALIFAFYIFVLATLIAQLATLQPHHGAAQHGPQAVATVLGMFGRYLAVYGGLAGAVVIPLLPIAYGLRFSPPAFAYRAVAGSPE